MDTATLDSLETAREIDDLTLTVANLRYQLNYFEKANRTLRVQVRRYELAIGLEARKAA